MTSAANRQELPWNEKTAPNRVRPRECVGNARDALDRAYGHQERAAVPLLIEAIDWLRRALEQMVPEPPGPFFPKGFHPPLPPRSGDA